MIFFLVVCCSPTERLSFEHVFRLQCYQLRVLLLSNDLRVIERNVVNTKDGEFKKKCVKLISRDRDSFITLQMSSVFYCDGDESDSVVTGVCLRKRSVCQH